MDYVNLGATVLKVSRLCLGCMSFGIAGQGTHQWTNCGCPTIAMTRASILRR